MSLCCVAGPEWASYTLGVFVCHSCSGLHRNIAQISKVKSILLDPWSSSEVEVSTPVFCGWILFIQIPNTVESPQDQPSITLLEVMSAASDPAHPAPLCASLYACCSTPASLLGRIRQVKSSVSIQHSLKGMSQQLADTITIIVCGCVCVLNPGTLRL